MKPIIAAIIVSATLGVLGYLGLTTYQQSVANEAKFQCAQSSRYTVTSEGGSEVWYPVEELYNKCLSEKGLK